MTPEAQMHKQLLYLPQSTISPHDLFYAASEDEVFKCSTAIGRRFIRQRRADEIGECLIYTDASCYRNGREDAVGECIIACEPTLLSPRRPDDNTSFMDVARQEKATLPSQTVFGPKRFARPKSSRAKLYAAILAVEARPWDREGWKTIVIAIDMEYVVIGITTLVWKWKKNGWRKSNGKPVANIDLWKRLIASIEDLQASGVAVKFWKVSRVKGN
ncbi:unnamed protein product [Peniophora sp. CBMAI 1063]|nr:unnamed protein product [Peniophora sp. CBMAI 1063]